MLSSQLVWTDVMCCILLIAAMNCCPLQGTTILKMGLLFSPRQLRQLFRSYYSIGQGSISHQLVHIAAPLLTGQVSVTSCPIFWPPTTINFKISFFFLMLEGPPSTLVGLKIRLKNRRGHSFCSTATKQWNTYSMLPIKIRKCLLLNIIFKFILFSGF